MSAILISRICSELCRQIAKYKPRRIVIVDVYENCAYNIQQEMLRNYGKDYDLHVEIVSITDYDKMDELFTEFRPLPLRLCRRYNLQLRRRQR